MWWHLHLHISNPFLQSEAKFEQQWARHIIISVALEKRAMMLCEWNMKYKCKEGKVYDGVVGVKQLGFIASTEQEMPVIKEIGNNFLVTLARNECDNKVRTILPNRVLSLFLRGRSNRSYRGLFPWKVRALLREVFCFSLGESKVYLYCLE